MKVVILAGGRGTRISEYTKILPKPMIKIGSKPILEHIMRYYMKFGFNDFIIAGGYKHNIIKNYFKKKNFSNINLTFIEEKKPLGTAGALSLIKKKNSKPIIVLNGDLIFDFELENLLSFHKKKKSRFNYFGQKA